MDHYTNYKLSLSLRRAGMNQELASAFWCIKKKGQEQRQLLYKEDVIVSSLYFSHHYVAAFTGDDLNNFLPPVIKHGGVEYQMVITRDKDGLFLLEYIVPGAYFVKSLIKCNRHENETHLKGLAFCSLKKMKLI